MLEKLTGIKPLSSLREKFSFCRFISFTRFEGMAPDSELLLRSSSICN
uniref:Uncharacterized protein n=1 Tax=Arundo donax TaxID=35708 RepID=A0A0A9BNZ8_ARUDO